MIYSRNRQGSVLMLVIGLLTIVAMLGSTLMIVSYLSAHQTENVVIRGVVPITAGGVLLVLQNQLLADKHVKADGGTPIYDTGPYGSYAKTPESWKDYADFAGPEYGVNPIDKWLTEIGRRDAEPEPYIGRLLGGGRLVDSDGDAVVDPNEGGGVLDDGTEPPPPPTPDIYNDAYLADSKAIDAHGRRYFAAVRVIDTSGLACVNVGGQMDDMLHKPVNFDLKGLLGGSQSGVYNKLHIMRSGGSAISLEMYSRQCAQVLLSADEGGGYRPFPIADELFLRWRRPFAESERSKLRDVLGRLSSEVEVLLTTLSISSTIPRHPMRTSDDITALTREVIEDINGETNLKKWEILEGLYIRMRDIIGLSAGGGAKLPPIVMDDRGPGVEHSWFTGGSWQPYSLWMPGSSMSAHGTEYSYSPPTTARIAIRFTPTIAEGGDYAVYLWWPSGTLLQRASNVEVKVKAANESPTIVVNQDRNLGPSSAAPEDWHLLGTFRFDVGTTGYVEIRSTGQVGVIAIGDGVKFDYQPAEESREAAHFVANMWAYTSDKDPINESFKYMPGDTEWAVYGVVEQLVISEVYAYRQEASKNSDGDSNNDEQWVVAIELFNPTDEPVSVASGDNGRYYRLVCGDKSWAFNNTGSPVKVAGAPIVREGERVVLYAIHNGSSVAEANRLKPDDCGLDGALFFDVDAGGSGKSVLAQFFEKGLHIERYFSESTKPVMDSIRAYELPDVRSESSGSQMGFVAYRDDSYTPKGAREPDVSEADNGLSKHGRYRSLIPLYVVEHLYGEEPSAGQHTLGRPNLEKLDEAALGELAEVYEGFWIRRLKDIPSSIGGFGDVYLVGPDTDGGDLPHKLVVWAKDQYGNWYIDRDRSYFDKTSRGRANLGKVNPDPEKYPDLPWGTLIAEIMEVMTSDHRTPVMVAKGSDRIVAPIFTRVYGRININTAPKEILARLPWPTKLIAHNDAGTDVEWKLAPDIEIDPKKIAEYILTYRRIDGHRGGYENLDNQLGLLGDTLRQHIHEDVECSAFAGFLSPGELMIPLAAYVENELMGQPDDDIRREAYFLQARDSLYKAVANLITVNSDTFAANIYLQMEGGDRAWHYVALIDRSNCRRQLGTDDSIIAPVVLEMAEVK
ncbi:hypothetical protein LCGC14_0181460 [marine sediment metagenome]|uniref:Golvesin/Xly CBD-like domain-containing protein n=1 Tax=marine sediment metagenome TaxID=412755 RepID=A0A0F9XS47_9ZZZZ|nr:hypothetical protein [Phycisphaerae bacterium]HDZ44402.1 hypothetical protein [Phycisphaerae bacterium]